MLIRLICIKNPKPRTPFDFMTFFYHKRIKVLSKETKYFCFVNLNLFQILFSLRYFNNPEASGQHDTIMSGLIGVNWCNSCLLFTFDLYFLNRKERKVFAKHAKKKPRITLISTNYFSLFVYYLNVYYLFLTAKNTKFYAKHAKKKPRITLISTNYFSLFVYYLNVYYLFINYHFVYYLNVYYLFINYLL